MKLQEKYYRGTFVVFTAVKAIEAVAEIVLGVLLLFTSSVTNLILTLSQNELIEDPTDFFATHAQSLLHNTPHLQLFGALYMLLFGALKAFLVWGLLTKRLWTYPATLTLVGAVFLFQAAELIASHPAVLSVLSLFDVIFAALIWHEYTYLKGKQAAVGGAL
jgi:uncharacterized membrane protein